MRLFRKDEKGVFWEFKKASGSNQAKWQNAIGFDSQLVDENLGGYDYFFAEEATDLNWSEYYKGIDPKAHNLGIGYIDEKGQFFGSAHMIHPQLLTVLGKTTEEITELGWLYVSLGWSRYGEDKEPNAAQRETLKKIGFDNEDKPQDRNMGKTFHSAFPEGYKNIEFPESKAREVDATVAAEYIESGKIPEFSQT